MCFFYCFVWRSHSWHLSKYFRYALYSLPSILGTTLQNHTKQQVKLYFSLSQHLHPRTTNCRHTHTHHIYNLLASRHSPKFPFLTIFVLLAISHNDLTVPHIGETSWNSSHYFTAHCVTSTNTIYITTFQIRNTKCSNTQQYCQLYISPSEVNNILAWRWFE
jgi:hypothetical protein